MQFKVGNYRDGDRESNIRMVTGTIKADWIQLPVERYVAALPTLRHGVIAGVFRNKGAPWGLGLEKLQLSVFLPNDLSLHDWYAVPNDPSVALPFVDPRELLENPVPEGILEDDIPVFPSPGPIDPYPAAEPSAPSAAAPPSVT